MLIAPFLIVPVAAALLWKHAHLQPRVRPAQRHAHLGLAAVRLGQPAPARLDHQHPKLAIMVALIWQWTPFMMLILLAGLQCRPLDVIEAAQVDGASPGRSSGT